MIRDQIRIWGTVFAALLGLAFGSFLNVCLSRWPAGESIVAPRSHCRRCGRVLAWWENVPLLSWVALRGRCRGCGAWIGWRYVIVEAAVGGLWAVAGWRILRTTVSVPAPIYLFENKYELTGAVAFAILVWLLVALAVLDAEHLWLPDWLTWPGIVLGFVTTVFRTRLLYDMPGADAGKPSFAPGALRSLLGILAAAGVILLIRWTYWLIRRCEGIGLGDAKLMALLAAWLGLPGALLAFAIGVVLGALIAVVILVMPREQEIGKARGLVKLPLGTFLCVGGIVSALWGQGIISAYRSWAGF